MNPDVWIRTPDGDVVAALRAHYQPGQLADLHQQLVNAQPLAAAGDTWQDFVDLVHRAAYPRNP